MVSDWNWLTHAFSFPKPFLFPLCFWVKMELEVTQSRLQNVYNCVRMSEFCRVLKLCILREHRILSTMRFLMQVVSKGNVLISDWQHTGNKKLNISYTTLWLFIHVIQIKGHRQGWLNWHFLKNSFGVTVVNQNRLLGEPYLLLIPLQFYHPCHHYWLSHFRLG